MNLDGDDIPDEPQALTAVKSVGGAIAGSATAFAGKFRHRSSTRGRRANGGSFARRAQVVIWAGRMALRDKLSVSISAR